MDTEAIVLLLGWLAHFVGGRLLRSRAAATLADAVRIGQQAARVVRSLQAHMVIDTRSMLERLRSEVESAGRAVGLSPELLRQAYDIAEAEVGRLVLLESLDDLGGAADAALSKVQADRAKLGRLK